jgi:CRP-like cAMP-binding protein
MSSLVDRSSISGAGPKHSVVARRLSRLGPFSAAENQIISDMCQGQASAYPIRAIVGASREGGESLRFIASGWICRVRELKDGRRQLIQLLLPGDAVLSVSGSPRNHFLQSLTPAQLIDGSAFASAAAEPQRYPAIGRALTRLAEFERTLLMEYVVRLGRQAAVERVAHLLMEVRVRLGIVGMAEHDELPFRMTQEAMSDLLGLSPVHINRTLMTLKRTGLISIAHGRVNLLDVPALEKLAEFRMPA